MNSNSVWNMISGTSPAVLPLPSILQMQQQQQQQPSMPYFLPSLPQMSSSIMGPTPLSRPQFIVNQQHPQQQQPQQPQHQVPRSWNLPFPQSFAPPSYSCTDANLPIKHHNMEAMEANLSKKLPWNVSTAATCSEKGFHPSMKIGSLTSGVLANLYYDSYAIKTAPPSYDQGFISLTCPKSVSMIGRRTMVSKGEGDDQIRGEHDDEYDEDEDEDDDEEEEEEGEGGGGRGGGDEEDLYGAGESDDSWGPRKHLKKPNSVIGKRRIGRPSSKDKAMASSKRNRVQWPQSEERLLMDVVRRVGKKWSIVEKLVPNRTRNQCRERYRLLTRLGLCE